MTMDAFSNPAARIGFGTLDLLQATEYPMTRMTQNYQLLTSLYRENWIIQNIISTIPNDMMRKWYDLRTSVAPEYLKQMTQLERRTQIRKKLLLGMCWGRLYGGAVGVILIKGHNDMSQPLNLDTIMPGSFLGLHILVVGTECTRKESLSRIRKIQTSGFRCSTRSGMMKQGPWWRECTTVG